jgi:hypothetical protein
MNRGAFGIFLLRGIGFGILCYGAWKGKLDVAIFGVGLMLLTTQYNE